MPATGISNLSNGFASFPLDAGNVLAGAGTSAEITGMAMGAGAGSDASTVAGGAATTGAGGAGAGDSTTGADVTAGAAVTIAVSGDAASRDGMLRKMKRPETPTNTPAKKTMINFNSVSSWHVDSTQCYVRVRMHWFAVDRR